MDDKSCIIYSGEKFTLEWYYDEKELAMDYRQDYLERKTGGKNNGNDI